VKFCIYWLRLEEAKLSGLSWLRILPLEEGLDMGNRSVEIMLFRLVMVGWSPCGAVSVSLYGRAYWDIFIEEFP
jgi:hypothetical protein